MDEAKQEHTIKIRMPDDVLKGVYSNMMQVFHTKEEFVMDFMNGLPPQDLVNARIIVSPAHLKRIIAALATNLKKYEENFGTIPADSSPKTVDQPESTSGKKFGF